MKKELQLNQLFQNYNISDYDYIGVAVTPWHAYALKAALALIQKDSIEPLKGIICILRNHGEDYIIDESYLTDIDCECIYLDPTLEKREIASSFFDSILYSTLKYKSSDKKNFYILSQQKPWPLYMYMVDKYTRKSRNLISVICDEGVGSYINSDLDRLEPWNSKNLFRNIKRLLEQKLSTNCLENKLSKNNALYNYCLFEKTTNGLIENKVISNYLKDIMYKHAKSLDVNYPVIDRDYILINTQPFTNEAVSLELVNDLWKDIIRMYKSFGFDVYIKPHPREKDLTCYQAMGAKLIAESSIAQELLLMKMRRPKYLISLYSTTLVTAPVLNDVQTICLAPLLLDFSISIDLRRSAENFIETFKTNTNMVKSLNELEVYNGK